MLKFFVPGYEGSVGVWSASNTYLVGADGHAKRSEVDFCEGILAFDSREVASAAVFVQQDTGECGELLLQTCLLPQRAEPYLLNLELARHRIMLLYNKLEDWGMFDLPPNHPVARRAELARQLFVQALCLQSEDPASADKLARDSLVAALDGSEELALAHAEILLDRRRSTGAMPRHPIGCGVGLDKAHERVRAGLVANFDFLQLPISWRHLAPAEGEYRWETMDAWVQWLLRHKMPVIAGPLVSFEPGDIPDWLFMWEHDFETMRDLVYEHIEEVVKRYRHVVSVWNVASGLHVNDQFAMGVEQIMELTRLTTLRVKDLHPTAKVIVELRQPFGERSGNNLRSIPPLIYADLLIQNGVNVDGFGLKLVMGQAVQGHHTRDLLQISDLFDQFAPLNKSLHVTLAAPSKSAGRGGQAVDAAARGGHWRKPWSETVQGRWLAAVLKIGFSKPFMDSIAWQRLVDTDGIELPLSGLVDEQMQPKGGFRRLVTCRRDLGRGQGVDGDNQGRMTGSTSKTSVQKLGK